jgi:hypothetical protein
MKMDRLTMAHERAGAGPREHGLAMLTALTAAEIFGEAKPEQAHGLYVAIGRRFSTLVDMADVRDLDDLAERINGLWAVCGYGHARLQAVETGIRVVHRGAPVTIEGDHAGHWARLFPALLEGAYDAWFRQLGSSGLLSTRLLRHEGDVIEFHHGG